MIGHRLAAACVVASVIALQAVAQSPDTGPIAFPAVTNVNPITCSGSASLPGPSGGRVLPLRGGFFARNGIVYFGIAANQLPGCFNDMNIQFAPAVTQVSFTLRTFSPQTIAVFQDNTGNPTLYNLPRDGSVAITLSGSRTGLLIQGLALFGIADLVITQPAFNQTFVQFDVGPATPPTSDQTKILMSKAIWDIGYPSTVQLAPDSAGNPQVRIAGTLRDLVTSQPRSGAVFLRVTDPGDSAPYRGADAHDGDNDVQQSGVLSSTTVQADAQGRFEATLNIRSRTAGDNYQIVGAGDQTFNCAGLCGRSAVFTLWKRTYVEDSAMFRSGVFLTDGADAGATTFGVADGGPFQSLAPGARLKLIHADSGQGEGFYYEVVYFRSVQRDAAGNWSIIVDFDAALTGQPIAHDYGTSVGGGNLPSYLPWAPLLRDAIGIVDSDTYTASPAFVGPTLADAFVEMKQVPVIIDEVPHLNVVPQLPDIIQYADRWFEHTAGAPRKAMPNVLHRIAASQSAPIHVPAQNGQPAGWGVELGTTIVGGGSNVSFVFDQRISDLAAGPAVGPNGILIGGQYQNTNSAVVNAKTTAHETVHFWVHTQRTGVTDAQGHCNLQQYDDPSLTCLMHQPAGANGLDNASVHMHYTMLPSGTVDSEYLIIRRAADPVPQN